MYIATLKLRLRPLKLILKFIFMFILILIYVCYILGVLHKGQLVHDINLDDLGEGLYYCTINNTNSPVDYCWVLTVFDNPSGTGDKSQLAWALNNIWVRRKSVTWGGWLKYNAVADFYKGYNSLASLANALGVVSNAFGFVNFANNVGDLNAAYCHNNDMLHTAELGVFNITGNATNIPEGVSASLSAGVVLAFTRTGGAEYVVCQIYVPEQISSDNSLHCYMRCGRFNKNDAGGSESFKSWKQIY